MKCYSKYCRIMDTTGGVDCKDFDHCPYRDEDNPNDKNKSSIDHPAHYQGEYECIDLMREIYGDDAVRSFCICNSYKYRYRAGHKPNETAQSDIAKAEWYERYVMEHLMQNTLLSNEMFLKKVREIQSCGEE